MISIFNHLLSILSVPWIRSWPTNINFDIIGSGHHKACLYPESCWPSHYAWNALNDTLDGSLYRARPPPYVCHVPFINETACDIVKQNGTRYAFLHFYHSSRLHLYSEFWRAEQPGGYFDAGEINIDDPSFYSKSDNYN